MDTDLARETLDQLESYTGDVLKFLDLRNENKRNHSGYFQEGFPNGVICHYTGSNRAVTGTRPWGRLPTLLSRLRPGSSQGVGAHFVVWDEVEPRLVSFRQRYPLLQEVPAEVFFFGGKLRLWHAGAANSWSLGIEVRNCGELLRDKAGFLYWNRGRTRYRGEPPVEYGGKLWEPFTWSQMVAVLWVSRLVAAAYPIVPRRFLGHVHVSSTRTDPGPHFPLAALREAVFFTPELPLLEAPFLKSFTVSRLSSGSEEDLVAEEQVQEGLYRDSRDGDAVVDGGESQLGEEKSVSPSEEDLILAIKHKLRSFGYYTGRVDSPFFDQDLRDTLCLFQSRWKVLNSNVKSRRWQAEVKATGKIDEWTLKKLDQFGQDLIRYI